MRRLLPLALLALAGCAGAPIEAPPAAGVAPAFDPPQLIGQGGAMEATIAVAGETMLVCQMGDAERDVVLASHDAGATWTPLAIDRGVQSSTDCDVAIGPDGAWYVVFLDVVDEEVFGNGFTDGLLTFGASRDEGRTWRWTTLPGHANGLVDRPWLHVLDDGTLYLTHKSANFLPLTVHFQVSRDGGATWSDPTLVARAEDPARPNGNVGRMVVREAGARIFVPIHGFDALRGEGRDEWLDLAVSEDAGRTWSQQGIAGPLRMRPDFFLPSIAEANGTLYAAIPLANGSTAADLHLITSADAGATWGAPFPLALGQDFSDARAQASVALDGRPDGALQAAWYHWRDGWVVTTARIEGESVLWTQDLTQPAGDAADLEFLDVAHDAAGKTLVVASLPLDGCGERGGRDCVLLLRER